ncbi:hypothetical protein RclHR1_02010014 [Rhizophagus clarus]|uniref:Protein kinase domain-containing protein n=1 Tax=Rhizophagus clarus TaxID=94130 RepID=A0A2Z6QQU7_9GLOM|nr:hypothetical protein RclHR1_02010014 [Rhizophagus clarus]
MAKNNKKLTDIDTKENEESEKNPYESHQNIFVSSDFKDTSEINKGLDDNNNEEFKSDSVELDSDKKISINDNEKILLVNNEENDKSIIEEHVTLLSTNQVNDESSISGIRYVKSNEFVPEDKNLKQPSINIETDLPINTTLLENKNQKCKSGSQYKKKVVAKYEEMTKNNKKSTLQTCTVPNRIVRNFKNNFKNWTSDNSEIDELIQNSQLDAMDSLSYLEWIDHKEIINIEYITRGGFGKIFKGEWIKGPRLQYSTTRYIWENIPNTTIALKELDNQEDFNQFLNEVRNHLKFLFNRENHVLRCFGITRSPNDDTELTKWLTKDIKDAKERPRLNSYMMYKRLDILEEISRALETIHNVGMIHQDLHCGNILMNDDDIFHFPAISDLGLCGNFNETGILIGARPYIAPEHLKENPELFTTASDIYSFGIIMWIIGCCKLPYEEFENDQFGLQINIAVRGLRLKIPEYIPTTYAELMKRCWDDDPGKRPKTFELKNTLLMWKKQYYSSQFFIAERERLHRIKNSAQVCDFLENQEIERSKLIHKKSKKSEKKVFSCEPFFDGATLSTVNFEISNNNDDNVNLIFIR